MNKEFEYDWQMLLNVEKSLLDIIHSMIIIESENKQDGEKYHYLLEQYNNLEKQEENIFNRLLTNKDDVIAKIESFKYTFALNYSIALIGNNDLLIQKRIINYFLKQTNYKEQDNLENELFLDIDSFFITLINKKINENLSEIVRIHLIKTKYKLVFVNRILEEKLLLVDKMNIKETYLSFHLYNDVDSNFIEYLLYSKRAAIMAGLLSIDNMKFIIPDNQKMIISDSLYLRSLFVYSNLDQINSFISILDEHIEKHYADDKNHYLSAINTVYNSFEKMKEDKKDIIILSRKPLN